MSETNLDKYNDPQPISSDMDKFKTDLEEMTSAILMRVTSEEDGVYLYWDF